MNGLFEVYGALRRCLMVIFALFFFVQSCASREFHYEMKKRAERGSGSSSRRSIFGGMSSLKSVEMGDRSNVHKTDSSIHDGGAVNVVEKSELREKTTKSSSCFWGATCAVVGLLVGFGITLGITYPIMKGRIDSAQGLYETCETQFSAFKSSASDTISLSNCQNSLNMSSLNLNICQSNLNSAYNNLSACENIASSSSNGLAICQNSLNATLTQLSTCSTNLANCILGSNTPGSGLSICNAALSTVTEDYISCSINLTNCAISTSTQLNILNNQILPTVQVCKSKLNTLCQDSVVANHLNAIGSSICS